MTEKTMIGAFFLLCAMLLAASVASVDLVEETGNAFVKVEQMLYQFWVESMNENTDW